MAEDRESSKARFKSKWNRVFKEKEEHEQKAAPHHTNSFKLDDDVTAFLQPSIDKAASTRPPLAPKIDIAIAQRWPSAHDVRTASAATEAKGDGSEYSPNGFTKPRRRPGLVVGFAKTVPEIMGHGGDETEEPPSEVSRRKALMSRSASNRVPSGTVEGQPWMGAVAQDPRQARIPNGSDDDFRPQPLRRAGTSFNEVSAPLQKRQVSQPLQESASEDMPRLSRTPTGLGSQDEHLARRDVDERSAVPQIDTRFLPQQTESPSNSLSGTTSADSSIYSPRTPEAMAARKRELRSGEGMALRRASAMIVDDDDVDEVQKRQSMSRGIRPPQQVYETLARPDAESLMPEVPEPRSAISPSSAVSPAGRSPFADPKYMQSRSQPRAPQIQQQAALPQQSWDLTPPEVEKPLQQPVRQKREQYQPSYMRAVQPAAPPQPSIGQVQPPPADDEVSRSRRDIAPSYMRSAQPEQPNMVVQQPTQRQDRSPLQDRLIGENAPPAQSREFYNKPNASNNSLNYLPPSPHSHHSRSSSRDGESPQQLMSPSSGYQQSLPSPRFQNQSGSPKSGSPRTSVVGKPSMLSPYSEAASQSYFTGTKPAQAAQAQPLRPSGSYMPVDDPHSRPGSSGSNRSFQRPANSFSAPRPPQVRQPHPRIPSRQEDELGRPSTSDSGGSMPRRQVDPLAAQRSQPQTWMAKTAGANLREEDAQRPPSGSRQMQQPQPQRPTVSPQPTSEGNPAADAAYADFAARVAHMKGVFRLTAEKERPADQCSPHAWLRTALWWYLRGKSGLEVYLQQHRPRSPDGQPRELLTQPHVDLAKTWWILTDPLDPFDEGETSPQSASSNTAGSDVVLKQSIVVLRSHIKTLALSMSRSQLMPPPASLIQGQDTSIWLEYPRFTPDVGAVLSGQTNRSYIVEQAQSSLSPLEALPIGDMKDVFCYGRFPVDVFLRTDQANTDRMTLPCTLSMLRGKRDFLTTIVIASQNELVNVKVAPRAEGELGLTWHDVSWKASAFGMVIRLPHGFDLTIRMQERDFRSLWNLAEYARKVEHNLRTEPEEKLVHEAHLAELQYADSSNANAFPPDKIRRCTALVFERTSTIADGSGSRKVHRGYRLLLFTDPDHKSLASASHEVCRKSPLFFEFITDATAHGMAAMVVRIREDRRQCRILLVFPDVVSRQNFYDVLNGLAVGPDEAIVGKMNLASMNIEPANQTGGFNMQPHPALSVLQWQKLGVTNSISDDPHDQIPSTIASESLRLMARHTTGCITDRMNLSKGELLLRLPCVNRPAIQLLRNPQEDIGMSIDTRQSHASVSDGITELHALARSQPTIRTLTFTSMEDLHSFQTAITGSSVRYDGLAANLSIARRMMVVPIYKKWEALNVRLQIVAHSSVVQLLAFMEDFSHADALCFQVKSTDTFELMKGDSKGKKWGVKLVDAKFSLPRRAHEEREEKHRKEKDKKKDDKESEKKEVEMSPEEREAKVRQRFVNLEGLEYAEEHDDITVGFESVEGKLSFNCV